MQAPRSQGKLDSESTSLGPYFLIHEHSSYGTGALPERKNVGQTRQAHPAVPPHIRHARHRVTDKTASGSKHGYWQDSALAGGGALQYYIAGVPVLLRVSDGVAKVEGGGISLPHRGRRSRGQCTHILDKPHPLLRNHTPTK